MHPFLKIASVLSSPVILIAAVWCAGLIVVAIGPIEYPLQPSLAVLVVVAAGVSLFALAQPAGAWCFNVWSRQRPDLPAPSARTLNRVVAATSFLGIAGIALIAVDRTILSGVGLGGYAELLRCAPDVVNFIEIQRTPLLYLGYLTFSFGFASLLLFLLNGGAAIAAQLSILSPVGYALLYSGRMPILFVATLILAVMLVRIRQGRRIVPQGRHLLIKMVVAFILFAVYSSAVWSSRQAFCARVGGLVLELQERMKERDLAQAGPASTPSVPRKTEPRQNLRPGFDRPQAAQTGQRRSADSISAADLTRMVDGTKPSPVASQLSPAATQAVHSAEIEALVAKMKESWNVTPREYVLSAIESGRFSPRILTNALSTYFYLTHGISMLDLTWHAREQFTPNWGIYEIGVLSPILRVFFPQNRLLASMGEQLKSANIYGFFPTVWAAAYIDFGAVGAGIYILIWGFVAGWSAFGTRHSELVLPPLLLTFILASILLSPIQGPLGIANSAMVLVSLAIVGIAADFSSLSTGSGRRRRELRPAMLA
jgi:hypothetical protein